jgi:hypothetical protein
MAKSVSWVPQFIIDLPLDGQEFDALHRSYRHRANLPKFRVCFIFPRWRALHVRSYLLHVGDPKTRLLIEQVH